MKLREKKKKEICRPLSESQVHFTWSQSTPSATSPEALTVPAPRCPAGLRTCRGGLSCLQASAHAVLTPRGAPCAPGHLLVLQNAAQTPSPPSRHRAPKDAANSFRFPEHSSNPEGSTRPQPT